MVTEARYPNQGSNISSPSWSKATSVSVHESTTGGLSTCTIYNAALTQPAGAYVGAIAHVALGQEWVDQTALITASSPGSITFSYLEETSSQVPRAGNRFYISGARVSLDSSGEWFRDPKSGLLYLWDPSNDSPAKHTIEAKARQFGFDLSGDSNITIEGIKLTACTINTDANSTGIIIDHLTGTYISHAIGLGADQQDPWGAKFHPHTTGIILNGIGNLIENSTISYSSGDGVFLGGSNNTVQNCIIHDVDYEAGDEAGISTLGSDEQVIGNTIYNTGRSGMVIRFTTASLISHNVIHNVGMQMTDLGAIYSWGSDGQGTEISYNVIYAVHTGGLGAGGVYLDNGCQNYVIDHNVVWNTDFALKLNAPSWNNLVVNNTFVGTSYGLQSSNNVDMTGTRFFNNIFVNRVMIGAAATQTNNIFQGTDPKFVSTSTNNYQLQATSPAIGAGIVFSPYTDGYLGSKPDIGAYEYGVPAFSSGAVPLPIVSSVPPGAIGATTANNYFSPQTYSAQSGTSFSGDGVKFTGKSSWIEFKGIDLGQGVSQFVAQISHIPTTNQRLYIRIDSSTGTTLGTLAIPGAATSSSVAQTLTTILSSAASGIHNIFIINPDAGFAAELDGFTFISAPTDPNSGSSGTQARIAIAGIDALSYDANKGSEAPSAGGLGYIMAGDWIEYANVDFGTGVSQVTFLIALAAKFAGQKIVLRLDNPTGPTIGTLVTVGTADWFTYANESTAITGASGLHNLYLCMVGTGAIANIQTITFS
jgi:hypothetical protein